MARREVRQETLFDVALRSSWGRAGMAVGTLVVLAALWWLAFDYFTNEQDMGFVAWPVGIIAALLGWWLVGLIYRRGGPRARPVHASRGNLARHTANVLQSLAGPTSRVHPLGGPWPQAVVCPHVVYLVEPRPFEGTLRQEGDTVHHNGVPLSAADYGDVRRMVPMVEDVLERSGISIRVQGLIVVSTGTVLDSTLSAPDREVLFAHQDQVGYAIDRGGDTDQLDRAFDALRRWRPNSSP